ncbi:cytochrome c oxidase subunit 2A [Brevibacillus ruminantium]|uniref:Cytochrome c oxidase subunit 2A n=1 Tax=Brevibacillus ruminantium TaxID=2950604 RepID=A0ABY4WHS2_9BACL|nr:cytochrome c oxidase subunit 2A [Brevibacillus ruminantium]USG66254.1 cytochrome c oxidase subunit 2A [Brevibacillus ruminantium]
METKTETQRQLEEAKKLKPESQDLKGTFIAVLLVGAIILLSWFGVFGLFLDRA